MRIVIVLGVPHSPHPSRPALDVFALCTRSIEPAEQCVGADWFTAPWKGCVSLYVVECALA